MNRCIVLELTPHAPAIFSRDASTEGAHATLNAPTGAALLGWAAQKCYDELDAETAFTVFHSGKVRFSDAVRMVGDEPSFLNPATLFKPKHGAGKTALGRSAFTIANAVGIQAEAVKRKWVTMTGNQAPDPRTQHRLRTAISDGTADDGKLFGYAAVLPGKAKFRATIECDNGLDDPAWALIKQAFDGATLRIGRASSSGNGGSFVCSAVETATPWPVIKAKDYAPGDTISFWLLSDAQLVDQYGNPKVDLEPTDFGLAQTDWALNAAETAVTARRIWPWNRKYDSRDMEITLIEAGSVVSFKRTATEGADAPKSIIGIGQERGFGRVAVLGAFNYVKTEVKDKPVAPVANETTLTKWAKSRAENISIERDHSWADGLIADIQDRLKRMGHEAPGPTQWSKLDGIVDAFTSGEEGFAAKLDNEIKNSDWSAGYAGLDIWVRATLFAKPEYVEDMTWKQRGPAIHRVIKAARAMQQGQRS